MCEWQLAVGRHTKSMWVWGVITVRMCVFLLPDTTEQRGIDIREKFNKSTVSFKDMPLTPDYICTFYKNSQLLMANLFWHIPTERNLNVSPAKTTPFSLQSFHRWLTCVRPLTGTAFALDSNTCWMTCCTLTHVCSVNTSLILYMSTMLCQQNYRDMITLRR